LTIENGSINVGLTLEDKTGCSETPVRIYHYSLRNSTEGCNSQILDVWNKEENKTLLRRQIKKHGEISASCD